MKPEFHILYCVPPNYQYLMAEIYWKNEHWVELNTEQGDLRVVFYARASGEHWSMPIDDVLEALSEAKTQLKNRSIFFHPKK